MDKINDSNLRISNRKRAKILEYGIDNFLNDGMAIISAAIIGFLLFFSFFKNSYLPFRKEKDYIKMEMERSFDKEEYLYWKSELKKLYISKIPIIGFIVKQKHKKKLRNRIKKKRLAIKWKESINQYIP